MVIKPNDLHAVDELTVLDALCVTVQLSSHTTHTMNRPDVLLFRAQSDAHNRKYTILPVTDRGTHYCTAALSTRTV